MFDVCVVGAGVEGSATARYLASRGKKTLLLEQFPLPHTRGSSHGQTRLVRYGYPEEFMTKIMPEAFRMWKEIEQVSGVSLVKKVGVLSMQGPPYNIINPMEKGMMRMGLSYEYLSAEQIQERYPSIALPQEFAGVLDLEGGFILASRAVKTMQEQFVKFGGALHDGEKVLAIEPGPVVKIQTNKSSYQARHIIITPGPWANETLKLVGLSLPLQLQRVNLCFWEADKPETFTVESGFPCIRFPEERLYGFPIFEYPGLVKICPHKGVEVDSPDSRDTQCARQNDVNIRRASQSIQRYFPGVKEQPSIVETCMYTVTPDEMFVLDRHPKFANIVVGAGFSGHGFKMAPIIGKILSQLALGEETGFDLSHFKMSRFGEVQGVKSSL